MIPKLNPLLLARVRRKACLSFFEAQCSFNFLKPQSIALGIADWLGSWFGLSVHIKIYANSDEVAILKYVLLVASVYDRLLSCSPPLNSLPECIQYGELIPAKPLGGWVNKV